MEKLQNLRSVLKKMSGEHGEVNRELKEIQLTEYIKNQPKIN